MKIREYEAKNNSENVDHVNHINSTQFTVEIVVNIKITLRSSEDDEERLCFPYSSSESISVWDCFQLCTVLFNICKF